MCGRVFSPPLLWGFAPRTWDSTDRVFSSGHCLCLSRLGFAISDGKGRFSGVVAGSEAGVGGSSAPLTC